jgi:hypothetical protein
VVDDAVQRAYELARARGWDADEGDDNADALRRLTPLERAIYVTRELEQELADGGWYLVFANENEDLVSVAMRAYEFLGLPAHAEHLRSVLDSGFGDSSNEDDGDALDRAFAVLDGAEAGRARALKAAQGGAT